MDNNEKICCFCGKPYVYGNSTWGYWLSIGESESDNEEKGEKCRCCDECNLKYVIPARLCLMK